MTPTYEIIARGVVRLMDQGVLRPGDRMPSVRRVSRQRRVSVTTAVAAYAWLADRGYLEARARSGFFVRLRHDDRILEPRIESMRLKPTVVGPGEILAEVTAAAADPTNVAFGAGCASPDLFPNQRLNAIIRRIVRDEPLHSAQYAFSPGVEELRRQIARRAPDAGYEIAPEEIVVTSGALEGINLSLRAVVRPGDVVAVESPVYFGILQSVASLNLQVIEITTDPRSGMDLDELESVVQKYRVKACVAMPNCHNPLGYVLPDSYKRALARLAERRGFAIVEDDIYGDLSFADVRARAIKSFDRSGRVLLCSSISKVLAPGYRVGWVMAGRYRATVERLKLLTSIGACNLTQRVVASFLQSGGYDRHVKSLRRMLAKQGEAVRGAIAQYFPEGTRVSRPAGGYMVWVELPPDVDAVDLYRRALEQRISIVPGPVFSASGLYRNCIRLNCGMAWTSRHDHALLTLGRICRTVQSDR